MGDEVEIEDDANQDAPRVRGRHIRKRALKNKALSVTFDEKDLRDFVTGFHKRKKKRRKEAQKQQEEAQRRKRIEQRKKRKLERELAYYDGGPPSNDTELDGDDELLENDEETQPQISTSAMAVYDNGDMKVTVKTSEIAPDEENDPIEKTWTSKATRADKGHSVPVNKKSFKEVAKHKPHRKVQNKREKYKGKKKNKKTR
ncbi:ribosomal RNA-processing protein 17 [Rhodamnia argentea]|uniref:Ribosomal RNA-processing protein 17 n=1 Tax=Rhodamnia argentea TaxID=178133 RepID=A0A8B8P507_9MYRT|nr:ribosomal RNA-processing protein 17 [Rhodamnia argentea]